MSDQPDGSVRLAGAPIVEGAVAAEVTAATGQPPEAGGEAMNAWQEQPPDMTPFEIRSAWPTGAEVWIRVTRCPDEVSARRWVEAESEAAVRWDMLLRGSFRP